MQHENEHRKHYQLQGCPRIKEHRVRYVLVPTFASLAHPINPARRNCSSLFYKPLSLYLISSIPPYPVLLLSFSSHLFAFLLFTSIRRSHRVAPIPIVLDSTCDTAGSSSSSSSWGYCLGKVSTFNEKHGGEREGRKNLVRCRELVVNLRK